MAVVVMLVSAAWQRLTGPTHPTSGTVVLGDTQVGFRLTRSHSITSDQPVSVTAGAGDIEGEVRWRRFPSDESWQSLPMVREGAALVALLPRQPAAGKLEYQVQLRRGDVTTVIPARPVVTRFKGDVSTPLLLTHVVLMFASLLLSARAGLGAAAGTPACRPATVALGLWIVGGLVLGPAVQKQAFDAWWTGIPFGSDLTDNKTLVAVLAWALAAWQCRRPGGGRWAILGATLVTFVVFSIPHSVWGSEIDWRSTGP